MSVWLVARRHGIAPSELFTVSEYRAVQQQVRELQELPGFGQSVRANLARPMHEGWRV
jgi:hypothetical protein